jgi:hypothetical protein
MEPNINRLSCLIAVSAVFWCYAALPISPRRKNNSSVSVAYMWVTPKRKVAQISFALVIGLSCSTVNAGELSGFIFTSDKVINANNEREFVKVGERLPIAQLKKRFSSYKLISTAGEDCLICAKIVKSSHSLQVNYDENGIVITSVFSEDKSSSDALGHSVGTPLQEAIGSKTSKCDAGMWTTCESPKLSGLRYIVEENEKCDLRVNDKGGDTEIPSCARIGGFIIIEKR